MLLTELADDISLVFMRLSGILNHGAFLMPQQGVAINISSLKKEKIVIFAPLHSGHMLARKSENNTVALFMRCSCQYADIPGLFALSEEAYSIVFKQPGISSCKVGGLCVASDLRV